MNTLITYLYRDSDNYKVHNACVVPGEFTESDVNQIADSLIDGTWFIPCVVGLPEEKFDNYDPFVDHELFEISPRNDLSLTEAQPTLSCNIHELAAAFAAAKGNWEVLNIVNQY